MRKIAQKLKKQNYILQWIYSLIQERKEENLIDEGREFHSLEEEKSEGEMRFYKRKVRG